MPLLVTILKNKNKSKYLAQESIAYLKKQKQKHKKQKILMLPVISTIFPSSQKG